MSVLETMCIDPQHRRQGIGSTLMHFGVEAALGHGVDSFVQVSPIARPSHESFGYLTIAMNRIHPEKPDASETWKSRCKELSDFIWFVMIRPRTQS